MDKTKKVGHIFGLLLPVILMALVLEGAVQCGRMLLDARGHGRVSAEGRTFTESAGPLRNPGRGFYHMHGFRINDGETDFRQNVADRFCRDENTALTLIEVNLQYYHDRPISEAGLVNLENLFDALDGVDKLLVVRFLYDWEGKNEDWEPEDIEIILEHMRQVAPVLNAHKDQIFTLQGLFIGNWGEMNGTLYSGREDLRTLAEQLADVTDEDIRLAVRMPMHWRMITGYGSAEDVSEGDPAARLGLYNDGMLGSWSDYGTYGDRSRAKHGDLTYWNREEELAFQEELCKIVPIGGEVIVDNPYNDFENAVEDMRRMHVTYISRDYDSEVLKKWESATVQEEGCFQGMDGLTYIERHLGYRLLLRETTLDYRLREDELSVDAVVQNVGFAPLYRTVEVRMTLYDPETGETRSYLPEHRLSSLAGGNETELTDTIHLEIDLSGMAVGRYELYLELKDSATGERITLANEQEPDGYGYLIGEVETEPTESLTDEWGRKLKGTLTDEWSRKLSETLMGERQGDIGTD